MIVELDKRVRKVLEEYPATRDKDSLLVAIIWDDELGGPRKTHEITAFQMLSMISRGELSNFDSVARARRKIQENGDFRGERWEERHRLEQEVKQEIKDYNNGNLFKED